jgi:adenylate cyclase
MPQVIIEQPGVPAVTVPLSRQLIRFGRAEDNEVVLVAEEVSRHHAELHRRGDSFVLLDKKSLNGTYVNRQRVAERPLAHMDEIWFGSKCRLVYRDDTSFGRDESQKHDSKLLQDVDKIREEMDRVGDNLTLIARAGRTPAPGGTTLVQTPAPRPADLMAVSRAYRRLSALYRASKLIASDFDLSRRLSDVLDTAMEVMDADRGFVLLREQDGNLRVSVAREMGQDLEASSPSMGVAGKAAIDGEPVLMAGGAENGLNLRESVVRQRITGAMAVPLKMEDRILGSIYVDTRRWDVSFNEEDLELFASLAAQLAMAIDNVHLYQANLAIEKKRSNLSRFLSPAIVEQIMEEGSKLELGGSKRVVTTLFCDIRGFTPIAERMPPHEMVELLNEHFSAMTELVFNYKGTLDKYIGDELMAVFGAPIAAEDDPLRAARAAVAIQAKNVELNTVRFEEGRPRLELGIGINTGEVIAGYIGSPMRMEFTVVGDHVNTARRLCDIAKNGQTIIGGPTWRKIKDHAETLAIGAVVLEGKANPVDAYELIGMKT